MGRIILIVFLFISVVGFSQTNSSKYSRSADTSQNIIQTTKSGGIAKYLLITGTDTAEIRWDGTNLLIDTTLEIRGRIEITGTGNSVFIGEDTGLNDDLTDNQNVFISPDAGKANTIGSVNVFIGYQTGLANTIADKNIGIGSLTLLANTTGFGNVGIGYNSIKFLDGGNNNVSIGSNVMNALITGNTNVAVGNEVLGNITTTDDNIGIGGGAGNLISDGNNNVTPENSIFIGKDTRANADGETNQIVIGYEAIGNGPNSFTAGDDNITHVWMNEDGTAIVHAGQYRLTALNSAPASAGATGTLGEIRITADFIYVCTATDTWKRTAITTW